MKLGKNLALLSKKEFDSKPQDSEKYLKTEIKSYNKKVNTNFYNNKISKEGSQCICLWVILIDSIYRKDYYPQVILEESKYVLKEKNTSNFITDDIESSFDDSEK